MIKLFIQNPVLVYNITILQVLLLQMILTEKYKGTDPATPHHNKIKFFIF